MHEEGRNTLKPLWRLPCHIIHRGKLFIFAFFAFTSISNEFQPPSPHSTAWKPTPQNQEGQSVFQDFAWRQWPKCWANLKSYKAVGTPNIPFHLNLPLRTCLTSFIHSFNKYLWSTCYMEGSILSVGDTGLEKVDKACAFICVCVCVCWGGDD